MISNFFSRTEAAPSLLSVIHSESSKTEQVTMKANFIYFWSVVSEFGIFWENWTIFELSCMYWQQWLQKTETQLCNQCCQYKSAQKEPKIVQFSQKKAKLMLTLMSKKKEFSITNSDSTLHVWMKFAFIVTCLVFFLIRNELRIIFEWSSKLIQLLFHRQLGLLVKSSVAQFNWAALANLKNVACGIHWG